MRAGFMNSMPTSAVMSAIEYVSPARLTITAQTSTNLSLAWSGGHAPYQVQMKSNLVDPVWSNSGSPITTNAAVIPIDAAQSFIRVVSQ